MGINKKIIETEATPPETAGFNIITYTGNASTNSITGFGFAPDLIWLKDRDTGYPHYLYDSSRGALRALRPSEVDAESNNLGITSFDSDGFTLDSNAGANQGGSPNIAWAWKVNGGVTSTNTNGTITSTTQVNNASGISIVKYDGSLVSGSTTTIGHGLSSPPELIILKVYEPGLTASSWFVYSSSLTNYYELNLNNTNAVSTDYNRWNNTAPTSSVFSVGSSFSSYPAYYGGDAIAYCFHSVSGFSKFGSYQGNGSSTGPTVTTGFQPDFVIIKKTDSAGYSWYMFDSVRDTGNPKQTILKANDGGAEFTVANSIQFNATSFQPKNTDPGWNQSGANYIYMAFKIT